MALHLLVAILVSSLRFTFTRSKRIPSFFRFWRDWYPFLAFPLLYKEVEILAAAFGDWSLTGPIRALETSLFAGQPSIYLSEYWPWVPLSEYLHFCYFSYILIIPTVAAYWYAARRAAYQELILLLGGTFYSSYIFFVLFPVDSPYYFPERLGEPMAGQFFYDLVHELSSLGGARGGAFPSGHVSASVVLLLVAWRSQRQLAYGLLPIVSGIAVATVYGRFHYLLDSIAGIVLAATVVISYWFLESKHAALPEPS